VPTVSYSVLAARDSHNIGDEIQTIAVEQLLPRVDHRIDRMDLASYRGDQPRLVVMNGWFAPPGMNWPPSENILPFFFGFHATDTLDWRSKMISPRLKEYYQRHAPIGCRDNATREAFESIGVEASTTWCATLTLERRRRPPSRQSGKVFLVNADFVPVPMSLRRNAVRISHRIDQSLSSATKRTLALELLAKYRDEASVVVTTKLHCAMPCAAMGIPTVFIGNPADRRLEPALQAIPLHGFVHKKTRIHRRIHRSAINRQFIASVNWNPPVPEFEQLKQAMRDTFHSQLLIAESRRN